MSTPIESDVRYSFGKNWARFVERNFSEERVGHAQSKILTFLNLRDLKGKTFLDIGCGSGLHSLAAWQAGATQVMSFDFDPESVAVTQKLVKYVGSPRNWDVLEGSILDMAFVENLGRFDVVYSWGVLHHTGSVWEALNSTLGCVGRGGLLYIALYAADVQVDPSTEYWLDIKRKYNAASAFGKRKMEVEYIWRFGMQGKWRNIRFEVKKALNRNRARGMEYMTDIRDWLGGWPMEFVWDAEVIERCQLAGFELKKIDTGQACSEYLFQRTI